MVNELPRKKGKYHPKVFTLVTISKSVHIAAARSTLTPEVTSSKIFSMRTCRSESKSGQPNPPWAYIQHAAAGLTLTFNVYWHTVFPLTVPHAQVVPHPLNCAPWIDIKKLPVPHSLIVPQSLFAFSSYILRWVWSLPLKLFFTITEHRSFGFACILTSFAHY